MLAKGPRILAILVRRGTDKFGFISGHCPHTGHPADRDAFLRMFRKPGAASQECPDAAVWSGPKWQGTHRISVRHWQPGM